MPATTVIARRNCTVTAACGLVVLAGPLTAAWIVATWLPWSAWTALAVSACTLFALRFAPTLARLVDRIEVSPHAVRLRRFWSRRWLRYEPRELVGLWLQAARPHPARERAHGHAHLQRHAYLLRFADETLLHLDLRLFPGAERAIEALVVDPATGFWAETTLAGMTLVAMTALRDGGTRGRLYAYAGDAKTTCTLSIYRRQRPVDLARERAEYHEQLRRLWSRSAPAHAPLHHAGDHPFTLRAGGADRPGTMSRFHARVDAVEHETRLYLSAVDAHIVFVRVSTREPGAWFDARCARLVRELGERFTRPGAA